MHIDKCGLWFKEPDGAQVFVTIADILSDGTPIDAESEEELELVSNEVVRRFPVCQGIPQV